MNLPFNLEIELDETDPIRRFLLLAVAMAQQDRATALIIGSARKDEGSTDLQFRVDGRWLNFPCYPKPLRIVATELESMTGLSETKREGLFVGTVDRVDLRWRVEVKAPGTEYVLTPINDERTKLTA